MVIWIVGIALLVMFSCRGITISWMLRLQKCVALSRLKAKYVAISKPGKNMLWLRKMENYHDDRALYTDNQSALCFAKNHVFRSRNKHI